MADTNVAEVAGKKVGPLPMGVWIAAIGGGLIIAYYGTKSKSSNPTLTVAGTAGQESGVGTGAVGGWAYQPPTALPSAATYTTNQEWARAAINYLIGQNYDAGLADAAIRNYIGGLQVSIQQQPLVDAALKALGPPPQVLNPITGPVPDTPVPSGGGGPVNTPPPTPGPGGSGVFGLLFGFLDMLGLSGSVSGIHVPVNGQDYQVTGSYGNNSGTVTVTNPDGSTATVNSNPLMSSTGNATTTPVGTTTGTRSYSVLDGDTMTSISMKMYGSTLQQDKIYNANLQQIPDRDHLITGTVLSIPE